LDIDPQRKSSFVSGSRRLCQISSKSVKIATVRARTDRHTQTEMTRVIL